MCWWMIFMGNRWKKITCISAVKMDENWGYHLEETSCCWIHWVWNPRFSRSFAMAGAALQRSEICEEQVRQRGSKEKGPGPLAHFRSRGQGRGKLGNFCENQVALLAQRIRDSLENCTSCTLKIHMLGVECGFKGEPSWAIEPVLTTCFLPAGGLLPSFGQKRVHDPNKEEFWIRSEAPNQILAKSRQCSEWQWLWWFWCKGRWPGIWWCRHPWFLHLNSCGRAKP